MADGASSLVRLRLSFDYPPPAAAGCRLCWLLVDLTRCRVVADLESLIRDKFQFSRGSILSLFIQDCYLPHTESVYVVRDNDSVRVKVDSASPVNGLGSCPSSDGVRYRKRKSAIEEEDQRVVRKKKRKRRGEAEEQDSTGGAGEQDTPGLSPAKTPKKKKKKKNRTASERVCPSATPNPPPAVHNPHSLRSQRSEGTAGRPGPKALLPPSSSSSSSSDESTRTKPPTAPSNPPQTPKPLKTSDSLQEQTAAPPSDPPYSSQTLQQQQEEEEEEEIQLVIHPPRQQRGEGRGGSRDHRGGSRGGRFDSRAKQPPYEPEAPTASVVLQNGAHRPDYTSMPLLAAPPQVGQSIAFKLLELTENYSPQVSQYKEGRILSFDPATRQIEVELLAASQSPSEPGKFDLVYVNPDGSERVEYAVSRGSRVTELWDTLIEPRLVI